MSTVTPAVDSHAHVFGGAEFPFSPETLYTPHPSQMGTPAKFRAVLAAHGMTHVLHLRGEHRRRGDERKTHRRPQPDGGIHHSDETQDSTHAVTLGKSTGRAKRGFGPRHSKPRSANPSSSNPR